MLFAQSKSADSKQIFSDRNVCSCLLYTSIAAHEGCTAIIGVDAHNNQYLETPFYYDRANGTLQKPVSYTHLDVYKRQGSYR